MGLLVTDIGLGCAHLVPWGSFQNNLSIL